MNIIYVVLKAVQIIKSMTTENGTSRSLNWTGYSDLSGVLRCKLPAPVLSPRLVAILQAAVFSNGILQTQDAV